MSNGIEIGNNGMWIATGEQATRLVRLKFLLRGLDFEIKFGGRLTNKTRSCYAIIKSEFNLKGSRAKVRDAFAKYVDEQAAQVTVTRS